MRVNSCSWKSRGAREERDHSCQKGGGPLAGVAVPYGHISTPTPLVNPSNLSTIALRSQPITLDPLLRVPAPSPRPNFDTRSLASSPCPRPLLVLLTIPTRFLSPLFHYPSSCPTVPISPPLTLRFAPTCLPIPVTFIPRLPCHVLLAHIVRARFSRIVRVVIAVGFEGIEMAQKE